MQWHNDENMRTLPWKKETDPYKIWLSEIIMQQTRVEQGTPYYEKFIENYPTIHHLAKAADEDVYRLWQGLGYYNRCRNLLHTARFITDNLKGKFPKTFEEVLQLKGIGNYTAAAIVSFAYKLPYAVVDGNVQRVLARFFGIEIAIDSTEGKKIFQTLAQELLDITAPAEYNQAIMDFGAIICKPALPLCSECLLQPKCFAYKKELTSTLPLKSKKIKIKTRYFNYILFHFKDEIWIQRREQKDIWHHLHQPILIETDKPISEKKLATKTFGDKAKLYKLKHEDSSSQKLSHQIIEAQFFTINLSERKFPFKDSGNWVKIQRLSKLAFPKTIVSFFEKKGYF